MKISTFLNSLKLITADVTEDKTLLTSFNSLAKNNKGFWKSEKQGLFLLHSIKNRTQDHAFSSWTNGHDSLAISKTLTFHTTQDLGYGKTDVSKIRMIGWVAILDEGGIVAIAKGKVQHATGSEEKEGDWKIIPSSLQTTFSRPESEKPSIVVDFFGGERKKQEETQKRVEESKPLLEKIKSIKNWMSSDFLKAMAEKVEDGIPLTPNMIQALDRIFEKETGKSTGMDLGIGSLEDWQKDFETIKHVVKTVIAPVLGDILEERRKEYVKENEIKKSKGWGITLEEHPYTYQETSKKWAVYAFINPGENQQEYGAFWIEFYHILSKFFAPSWLGIDTTSNYWWIALVEQATKTFKKKTPAAKLTKKAIGFLRALKPLAEKFSKLTQGQIKAFVEKRG